MEFTNFFECTDTGKIQAIDEYYRLLANYKEELYSLRLICSMHPYSEGYWIEINTCRRKSVFHIRAHMIL